MEALLVIDPWPGLVQPKCLGGGAPCDAWGRTRNGLSGLEPQVRPSSLAVGSCGV
jgi:hypothetical protein